MKEKILRKRKVESSFNLSLQKNFIYTYYLFYPPQYHWYIGYLVGCWAFCQALLSIDLQIFASVKRLSKLQRRKFCFRLEKLAE